MIQKVLTFQLDNDGYHVVIKLDFIFDQFEMYLYTGFMQTGKSGKIISKSPKVWKVRECEKSVVPGQGKSGKIVLPKYLIRVVN